ncbi:hypothetical protein D6827_02995, partial [Candidatus Parcubacteria bacterium]
YYCGEIRPYANLSSFNGCSAIRGEDGTSSDSSTTSVTSTNKGYCQKTVVCPEGYWALVGAARNSSSETGTAADSCRKNNKGGSSWSRGTNACPYLCVPYNSFHANDGSACEAPDDYTTSGNAVYENETKYYYDEDYSIVDSWFDEYSDCTYYGATFAGTDSELGAYDFDTDGDLNGGGGIDYATESPAVDIYPACLSVVEVSSTDGDAVPWTDRILNPDKNYTADGGEFSYNVDTLNNPFGASNSPLSVSNNFSDIPDPTPLVVPACAVENSEGYQTTIYPVDDPDNGECSSSEIEAFGNDNGSTVEAREFVDWDETTWGDTYINTSNTFSDLTDRLSELFAKPLQIWEWDSEYNSNDLSIGGDGFGSYTDSYDPESYNDGDLNWDVRPAEGVPPTVWSVDLENCGTRYCAEGTENAFTVNSSDSGDISADGGYFRANLKFYAAADKNQLPIRRVIIDWGDGGDYTGSDGTDNYYKNHRGLQKTDEGVYSDTVSKCDLCTNDLSAGALSDKCEWGYTADSCDPNYFSYTHVYRCDSQDLRTLPTCADDNNDGDLDESPCVEGGKCVYQPRIHIRDNWGFCTGICSGDAAGEGEDYCYDGDGSLEVNKYEDDECYYNNYTDSTGVTDPWLYYDGYIYVEP